MLNITVSLKMLFKKITFMHVLGVEALVSQKCNISIYRGEGFYNRYVLIQTCPPNMTKQDDHFVSSNWKVCQFIDLNKR